MLVRDDTSVAVIDFPVPGVPVIKMFGLFLAFPEGPAATAIPTCHVRRGLISRLTMHMHSDLRGGNARLQTNSTEIHEICDQLVSVKLLCSQDQITVTILEAIMYSYDK